VSGSEREERTPPGERPASKFDAKKGREACEPSRMELAQQLAAGHSGFVHSEASCADDAPSLRVRQTEAKAAMDWSDACRAQRGKRAPGGEAALPCQNRNNSDQSPKRYRFRAVDGQPGIYKDREGRTWDLHDDGVLVRSGSPSSAEAKAALHLRLNVASFVRHFGREHCLFFTITDQENLHPSDFARRWNHYLRRNGTWILSFIRVLEPQLKGRPHYHLLVAVEWDTRPDDFDWASLFECQEERRARGYSARFRELRSRYSASAAPELVALWSLLRLVLPRYGLGRAETLPLRKGKEAISEYLGKYLEGGLALRRHSWKGCRRVEFDRRSKCAWICCSRAFSWNSIGARKWRFRVGKLGAALGIRELGDLRILLGPRWAYQLREAIMFDSDQQWEGFLSAIAVGHQEHPR